MGTSWDLNLSIDAHGHDDTRVSVVRGTGPSSPHLKVRTGLVVVHCLDGASAMSAARAWASARLAASTWLPPLRGAARKPTAPGAGTAYPVGSVLFEGRQPWHVEVTGGSLTVTVGPLQVRAHDATSLDTHIRAWTEASAVAAKIFPGKAVPFDRLVELERHAALRTVDEPIDRRYRRTQLPPAGPTPPDRDGPGRGGPGSGTGPA